MRFGAPWAVGRRSVAAGVSPAVRITTRYRLNGRRGRRPLRLCPL